MNNISITLCKGSKTERAAKKRLEDLLSRYDLSKYIFTDKVQIEDGIIPHSHPILTLNSFPYSDENIVLDTFVHEQLHWYIDSKPETQIAIEDIRTKFPNAPWGFPLGCSNQKSTYEHLILCHMSHEASKDLIGNEAAERVLYYLQNHHYIWVYRTIEDEEPFIKSVIEKYNLSIK